jgi:ferrochelatase
MVHEATGVVLMAYGAPQRLEDVPPFLDDIFEKGWLSGEHLEEITGRYRAIGGGSPLVAITRRQAEALERRLAEAGRPWPVAVGMRHSEPFIAEAVRHLVQGGCTRLVGLTVSPHVWTDAYRRALLDAADGMGEPPAVVVVGGWHTHPSYLEAWAASVRQAWESVPLDERGRATLVFTAHSLPVSVAAETPYESQVRETIEGIMERVGSQPWRFAWQSQGLRGGEWMGPDIPQTLASVAADGYQGVVFVPVGFVADHVEVLYDLDIEARRLAEEAGLGFHRAESLNDEPAFIEALAEAVLNIKDAAP